MPYNWQQESYRNRQRSNDTSDRGNNPLAGPEHTYQVEQVYIVVSSVLRFTKLIVI